MINSIIIMVMTMMMTFVKRIWPCGCKSQQTKLQSTRQDECQQTEYIPIKTWSTCTDKEMRKERNIALDYGDGMAFEGVDTV